MASVKPEPAVKPDPEDAAAAASPAVMSDDDLYEDAGDLEFYDPNITGDPNGNLFLAHVPAYLYEAWAQMNEGEEVEVGKMRRWTETDKNGQTHTRMAMLIDGRNSSHQSIPKEYNFDMRDTNLLNTFVFTEQDLPGFKSKAQGANSNIPGHLRNRLNRNQNNNNNNKQEGGRKRYQPYYRKAIPKKTALAGRFKYEVNCHPANTAESKHLLAVRNSESAIPKATTSMMSGTRAMTKNIIHAGTLTGNAKMSGFIQTTDAKAKAKKPQAERAARLDRHELLDRLAACFTQYRYWTMKAFKQQLNQPEAWLRENLDNIGTLHKTGPFANHWELNEVYKKSLQSTDNMAQGGTAPGDMGGDDSDFDGDDDNIEMEDVPAIE